MDIFKSDVKEGIEDYHQILAATIGSCVEFSVAFHRAYADLLSAVTNGDEQAVPASVYTGAGESYISLVENFQMLLSPCMKKDNSIDVDTAPLVSIHADALTNDYIKLYRTVRVYENLFKALLYFAKSKGLIITEKVREREGGELTPPAFKHSRDNDSD